MASIVGEVKNILQFETSANINNHVFRLYILTSFSLFLAGGVLITSQLFGDPIGCISSGYQNIPDGVKSTIEAFCWVGATYTVDELYGDDTQIGYQKIEPGVGQFDPRHNTQNFQLYYRWIFLLFFLQAVLFYIPQYLWKSWESGKMAGLSDMLGAPIEPNLDESFRYQRVSLLLNYLESFDSNAHNWYTYRFYALEVGNLLNVIFNVVITNWMLGGKFLDIGSDFMSHGVSSPLLIRLFPTHAKCLRRTFGPSGSSQAHDELCVLPLNSFNRFMFALLWFWYTALIVITVGWLVFRFLTIFKFVQTRLLGWKACDINCKDHKHKQNENCITTICKLFPHEDWFVLLQLVDNVDPVVIKLILEGLCLRLSDKNEFKRRPSKPYLSRILSNHDLMHTETEVPLLKQRK